LSGAAALSLDNTKLTASGSTPFFLVGANTLSIQASGKSLLDFSAAELFSLVTAGGVVNLDLYDGSSYVNGILAGTDGNFNVNVYGSGVRTPTLTGYTGTVSVVNVGSNPHVFTLTDGATIALDASKGPNYSVTIAGNRTLSNPTNAVSGQEITVAVVQDATGGRTLAFDTAWSSVDASVTVNPAANAVSIVTAWLYGSTWYYTVIHAAETGSGEANTASNVGTGTGWFKQKTAFDLEFKSALAGYGFSVSSGTNENTLALKTAVTTLTDGASIAVDADLGPQYMVTLGGNRTLANPTNSAVGKVLEIAVAQDGTGGRTLAFGTNFIAADSTVTVNPTASAVSLIRAIARDFGAGVKWYYTVTYVGDPSSGEANTASNVGTGTGVFKQKSGVDLEFKTLLAGFGLSISGGTNEVTIAENTTVTTLTDGATVAVDADLGPHFMLTVAGNRTLSNPTNSAAGKYLVIAVAQDGTGGRTLAFGTNFIAAGNQYQIAQSANAVSVIIAQARDFGGGIKWYYAITHGESTYVVSPAQIVANQNDYAPTGFSASDTLRLNTDASRNITGVTATASQKRKRLVNVGSFNIVVKNQDAGSTAANRFICPGGGDVTLTPDDSVELEYDDTSTRWRLV
jgi:hypothetical protein